MSRTQHFNEWEIDVHVIDFNESGDYYEPNEMEVIDLDAHKREEMKEIENTLKQRTKQKHKTKQKQQHFFIFSKKQIKQKKQNETRQQHFACLGCAGPASESPEKR
jgi:hypothetical protein